MAGEFSLITKDAACKIFIFINIYKIDLFYQNKLDHQLFLQNFSQTFEKQHKIRSFESSFGCTFGCTKGCTFDNYDLQRLKQR